MKADRVEVLKSILFLVGAKLVLVAILALVFLAFGAMIQSCNSNIAHDIEMYGPYDELD